MLGTPEQHPQTFSLTRKKEETQKFEPMALRLPEIPIIDDTTMEDIKNLPANTGNNHGVRTIVKNRELLYFNESNTDTPIKIHFKKVARTDVSGSTHFAISTSEDVEAKYWGETEQLQITSQQDYQGFQVQIEVMIGPFNTPLRELAIYEDKFIKEFRISADVIKVNDANDVAHQPCYEASVSVEGDKYDLTVTELREHAAAFSKKEIQGFVAQYIQKLPALRLQILELENFLEVKQAELRGKNPSLQF